MCQKWRWLEICYCMFNPESGSNGTPGRSSVPYHPRLSKWNIDKRNVILMIQKSPLERASIDVV